MKHDWICLKTAYDADELADLRADLIPNLSPEPVFSGAENTKKTSIVKYCELGSVKSLNKFKNIVIDINSNVFGFDIFNLNKYTQLHHALYRQELKGEYDWHTDGVKHEPFDIKLTAIINVSSETFEGGELCFFQNNEIVHHNFSLPGSIIVFPSYIPHCVKPVTKGKRETLTMFVSGPTWK